jgi:hypothetical protein
LFRVDVLRFPTIYYLPLGIFRSNFLKKDLKIPLNFNEIYTDIKDSYTGGSVDVFKPYGEDIKGSDVKYLYPYIIKLCKMPVATVKSFTGDNYLLREIPYGFCEVEVETPEYIRHPILQVKARTTKGGTRTI